MKNSNIEWTTHTFNPWIGCTKVSPGCAHCYAETLNKRMGWTQWGDAGERFRTSPQNWNEPRRWNREAAKTGQRARVFCASLADWLDYKAPTAWRVELLDLITECTELDWLLLTKRPESWSARMHEAMAAGSILARTWLNGMAPHNVWLGVSAEDQARWDERVKLANEIPAEVRFVSGEPLLGPIVMGAHRPDWLIVGGESGPGSREMKPEWVRALRDECAATGVRFFFKQWGGVKKKEAGRLLDGETFDQLPACAEESNATVERNPMNDQNKTSAESSAPALSVVASSAPFLLDRTGREILPGDTLKVFHFIGRRRKRHFMFKYVEAVQTRPEWGTALDALQISHLNPQHETWLKIRDGRQWMDCEIVQGYGKDGKPYDQRPKRKPNK